MIIEEQALKSFHSPLNIGSNAQDGLHLEGGAHLKLGVY
jgi:hypothetical protein